MSFCLLRLKSRFILFIALCLTCFKVSSGVDKTFLIQLANNLGAIWVLPIQYNCVLCSLLGHLHQTQYLINP